MPEVRPAATGMASAAAPKASPAGPPSVPGAGMWAGERLLAEVALKGITVGEYEMVVEAPCAIDGRPVLSVSSRAERKGIYAAFAESNANSRSWLDVETGYPVEARSHVESRISYKWFAVSFGDGGYHYIYHRHNKKNPRKYRYEDDRILPPHVPAHDMHSGLGLLRKWSFEMGKRGSFYAVVGKSLWRIDAKVTTRETITVGSDDFATVRIDGTARRLNKDLKVSKRVRAWSVWLSDEPVRLPVKGRLQTRDGVAEAELEKYTQEQVQPVLPPCVVPMIQPELAKR